MEPMHSEFFECECHSDEHTYRFIYDPDENELITSVFLNQYRSIFQRTWVALKYIFGYRCRYGHWDCFILRRQDAERLRGLLVKLIAAANAEGA